MNTRASGQGGAARSGGGFLWLLPATALLLVSNGRWIIPAAAWLAPVFLLRFMRTQRLRVGAIAGFLVVTAASAIAWRGLVPLPGAAYLVVATLIGLASFLPYVADRLLAHRLRGLPATLVLPAAAVTAEFASSLWSPYGTWGGAAYTQTRDLPLLQLVSVTGIWGISFLIMWFAAVVNAAWKSGFAWPAYRTVALTFASVFALVHLAGGARLVGAPGGDSVRVASFTVTPKPPLDVGDLLRRPRDVAGLDSLRRTLGAIQDSLLARGRREARAGARLVFWSETNAVVLKADEVRFIERGAALAHEQDIYLGMALASFTPGQGYYENVLVLLDPEGRVVERYHKARPVPGDPERGADSELPVVETVFGRVAGAICFDADFPSLIRDAGRARADMLIVPSSDWKAIDPIHTRMALVRGVENGCAVVRQTNLGLSASADAYGRTLASADYFRTRPYVMISQVPTSGTGTLYAFWGDLFAWLCLAGLLPLAALARDGRPRA